jgi:tetratricopeptide (TPR) repeat protein
MEPHATRAWIAGLGALLLLLAGCARPPERALAPDSLRLEVARRAPDLALRDVPILFELDQDVIERMDRETRGALDDADRLERVVEELSNPEGFGLRYEWATTLTAREALEHGGGNCLSLSSVLIGVARGLGMRAYYAETREIDSDWRSDIDLSVAAGHIAVVIPTNRGRAYVDFSGTLGPTRRFRAISDLEALAHYYNNRGYERLHLAMQAGQEPPWAEALREFELATRIAPGFAEAWNNVGLARRRLGEHDEAERAYHRALELQGDLLSAHLNLAALYVADGAMQDAMQSLDAAHRLAPDHPGVDRLRALAQQATSVR